MIDDYDLEVDILVRMSSGIHPLPALDDLIEDAMKRIRLDILALTKRARANEFGVTKSPNPTSKGQKTIV